MVDSDDEFALVEHELHPTELSVKPMVELEIAQSMVDSMRAHIVSSESTLATASDELAGAHALAQRQGLMIASMQKTITNRDITLAHCTNSLISTTSQYQSALETLKDRDAEIQHLKASLNELEVQYKMLRDDFKREAQEFKAYKHCHAQARRVQPYPPHTPHPVDQAMRAEGENRSLLSSLLDPTMFR
jgi:chromosome segregation ATPase